MVTRSLLVGVLLLAGCMHMELERDQLTEINDDAISLYKKGSFNEARQMFLAALAKKPNDPNLLFNIGQCYDHLHQPQQAEKTYQDCLAVDPNHPECRHALAVLMWDQHRQTDCQKMIEAWLVKKPDLAAANVELGWYYRQIGDTERAMGWYQQAIRHDNNNSRALVELGQLYEELNYNERALSLYERALENNPNQNDVQIRLASLKNKGVGRPKPE